MKRLVLPLLLLTAACAGMAPRTTEERQQGAALSACRQEAERVMRTRERGQTMRVDEAESRLGAGPFTGTSLAGSMNTERLGARYEQDQMIQDCLRGRQEGTTPGTAPPPAGGAGRGS
ncbi:hypothetical protein E0493_00675 [Roseomonas sp. M0104]|uniref:Lipoprotein n=1 Tax=Teichococcus coralli TaxID=2545983 RepID=A0A845B8Y8_9PROT|nr:hypothetical protein [Pseudoroseomonas coralli]MXP61862.1 hypothetical protein [Pseudoroseomonas coralli]